jgi:hypothetical protein
MPARPRRPPIQSTCGSFADDFLIGRHQNPNIDAALSQVRGGQPGGQSPKPVAFATIIHSDVGAWYPSPYAERL